MHQGKLLPIGSIVTLNRTDKKIMIIGRYQKSGNEVYEYSACLYPEGYLRADKMIVLNTVDIKDVYFIGFQDQDELEFNDKLIELMNNES